MQFFAKKFLISFCMIISVLANLVAQEKKYSFNWLDRSENKMTGNLSVNLIPIAGDGLYQLDFEVIWNDLAGNPIIDVNQMPYLCLSKYDLDLLPAQYFTCTSFDQKRPFHLLFPSTGKLNFQVLNGYRGEVKITARFQYALGKEDYEEGRSELIDLNGTNNLKMDFRVESILDSNDKELVADSKRPVTVSGYNPETMRRVAGQYDKTNSRVAEFKLHSTIEEINRANYLDDLEVLSASIEYEKALLNTDSLPQDTFQLYRDRYNSLNDAVLDLRTAYLRFRMAKSDLAADSDPVLRLQRDDSVRNLIRIRLEPVYRNQADSLVKIVEKQKSIALEISQLMSGDDMNLKNNPRADSLLSGHESVKQSFRKLQEAHDNSWKTYRSDIDGYGLLPISELESLHGTFITRQNDLQSAIEQVDRGLEIIGSGRSDLPWYQSNRLIWIGFVIILILVFVSAIWSTSRNRKILRERLTILERGSFIRGAKPKTEGILYDQVPNEYYTVNQEESIPECSIGKIHYHTSSIKSVYHMIQGALLERKSGDFGGYLFGNQYKLPGKGAVRNEIFIEKVIDSKYLRSSITNDINARTDLVDELDELVRQNKKYRLIGWFTSSPDNTMEIPEGLMKIHRSFFKEKWQMGILLNPASDVLQGAGFMRRTTGYLDPLPDPAAFLKWEDLYRFALNPMPVNGNGNHRTELTDKDYSRISLNNTWGDSIVAAVNFDLPVAGDIIAAAANQAIPKDTYQVVGYLYGWVKTLPAPEGKANEYEVFIDRFIELSNETTPRDLPGFSIIGWWGQANVDVINYLQDAVDYHEQTFRDAFQIACLVNQATGELRIFTRKHSLEMNNSTIETEDYSIKSLLSR